MKTAHLLWTGILALLAVAGCETPQEQVDFRMKNTMYIRDETLSPPVCSRVFMPGSQSSTEIAIPCESVANRTDVIVYSHAMHPSSP